MEAIREELESLAQIFGESNRMDSMWSGGGPVGSSNSSVIRGEIEKFAKMGQHSTPSIPYPQAQQELPPQIEPGIQNPLTPEELKLLEGIPINPQPVPIPNYQPPPQSNEGQLEFNFDRKEQEITNDILKDISKKLSRVIDLLSSKENVTKLKTEEKRIRPIS